MTERLAYRPAELAAMVGLSPKAIYRAIERGELRAAKVANGSRWLIPARDAGAWLSENAVQPQGPPVPRQGQTRGRESRRPLRTALADLDAGEDGG